MVYGNKLSNALGCPVVEISALKGNGVNEAIEKAVAAAKEQATTPKHSFDPRVEEIIGTVEEKLNTHIPQEQKRFFAIKLLEKDEKIAAFIDSKIDVTSEIQALEQALMMIQRVLLQMSGMSIFRVLLQNASQKETG